MDELLYQMIFKRKSFHLFRNRLEISPEEILKIQEKFPTLTPLDSSIRTDCVMVPAAETTCRRGEEFCILLYSESRGNFLQNIGYIGEQLDLYLASLNIGALWFGIGKTQQLTWKGLDFVIMTAIAKMPEDQFRKDLFKSKRKPMEEIWQGDSYRNIAEIARFAPSACNTQPWITETEPDKISVYRYKKPGKRGELCRLKRQLFTIGSISAFFCRFWNYV